jgi:hypothetical protein
MEGRLNPESNLWKAAVRAAMIIRASKRSGAGSKRLILMKSAPLRRLITDQG